MFLVAGQSNTDGRVDSSDGPTWIQDNIVDDVCVWNNSCLENYSLNNVGPNGNGSSWVVTQSYGNFSFAHIALNGIAASISNVVACQVTSGGTPLGAAENERGSWCPDYESIPDGSPRLLEELAGRYADLAAFCSANAITMNVLGLIWHQGEGDYAFGTTANYADNFASLVATVRSFTGNEGLPIYYGTVSQNSLQYSAIVETAHLSFASGDANAYCRDNSSLTLLEDNLHFDAASCITFGEWVRDTVLGV